MTRFDEITYESDRPFYSENRGIDAQVIVLGIAPLLSCVIVVVGSAFVFLTVDDFACHHVIAIMSFDNSLDALFHVCGNENIYHVVVFAQHVVGASSDKHTRPIGCRFLYCITLEQEQTLLREVAFVETVVADVRGVHT